MDPTTLKVLGMKKHSMHQSINCNINNNCLTLELHAQCDMQHTKFEKGDA
jgi:hypothetical protein